MVFGFYEEDKQAHNIRFIGNVILETKMQIWKNRCSVKWGKKTCLEVSEFRDIMASSRSHIELIII